MTDVGSAGAAEPLTIIVGRQSNLSQRLAARLPHCRLVSARQILADPGWRLPEEPHRLVINSFQPATRLADLSDPARYIELCIGLTSQLASQLAGSACTRVLYTSSASVYGDNVRCMETQQPNAASLHSALKLANEELLAACCARIGLDHTVLRLFNMYGGRDSFSVVSKLLTAVRDGTVFTLNNDGNAIRDFVHIDDVVETYLAVLGRSGPPIINVATGIGVSVRTLVAELRVRGVDVRTRSERRQEILASVADIGVLAGLVDVSRFRDVVDDVLQESSTAAVRGSFVQPFRGTTQRQESPAATGGAM